MLVKVHQVTGGTGKLWFILGGSMWETHIMVPALFCFVLAGMTEIFWGATGGFCFGEGSQCVAQANLELTKLCLPMPP